MIEFRWQISAVSDLANIRDYIALTSPLAAQSVTDRVVVVYCYREDLVEIVGVFHGAQDRTR